MISRRDLATLLALLATSAPVGEGVQPTEQLPGVTKAQLLAALQVMGLSFPDPQLELMLPRVNRLLGQLERLRQIEVPLDTEPAIAFSAAPPATARSKKVSYRPLKRRPRRDWNDAVDLAFWPVSELAPLLRAKKVTSLALTKMYLERLKQHGPRLNCVITLTEELALEQAQRADAEIRQGRYRGPLHGIPWGVKDLFATRGIPTTWGAEPFQHQVLDYDATAVTRLREAGAVLLAKLSVGALAMGGLWFGGMTKTPWNPERSSSGSSAGSAAATAAGLVGFSLGTETLGSIISPSIRCGAVGLRPTYGRVSRFGVMGLSWTMDKVGPICRSVEDCALIMKVIHGPDGRDSTVRAAPFSWDPQIPLSSLRVGVLESEFQKVDNKERPVFEQALQDLRKAGVNWQPTELPQFDASALLVILNAEAATAFDDLTRQGGVDQLKDQGPGAWPNTFRSSRLIPAVEYLRAQRARTLLQRAMHEFMDRWDVLVSPPGESLTVTNLTGHPQIVVPCGFVDGLPRGLVFTGRLCEEGLAMRVAWAYEQTTPWRKQRPPGFA
ncbi:MAG: amidase [Bryobacteraceae bacterium]|nr:amidase [Bryobacteraceae bacterium]MDW8377957.1 amidase [Bryobacterales bacterium]